jgi:transaldolase
LHGIGPDGIRIANAVPGFDWLRCTPSEVADGRSRKRDTLEREQAVGCDARTLPPSTVTTVASSRACDRAVMKLSAAMTVTANATTMTGDAVRYFMAYQLPGGA